MSDNLTPDDRRKTMQAVKSKGTKLEKRLWAMLAGMRLRGWNKNPKTVIGTPDVAFIDQRIAIFVDGCFWHGCPHCQRPLPKTNHEYWVKKINRNVELAQIYDERLRKDGWRVVRIWEHEMRSLQIIRKRILDVLKVMEA